MQSSIRNKKEFVIRKEFSGVNESVRDFAEVLGNFREFWGDLGVFGSFWEFSKLRFYDIKNYTEENLFFEYFTLVTSIESNKTSISFTIAW